MPKPKEVSSTLYKCVYRWVNFVWQKNCLDPFEKLEDQFQIGNQFIRFIELSSGKDVPRDISLVKVLTAFSEPGSKKSVTSVSPNHDCIAVGLYFLRFSEHFSLRDISVNDIASGNQTAIVRLLYSISLKYIFDPLCERFERPKKNAKEVILNYFKKFDKDLKIRSMRNFQDGFVLCYLLHYCNPDLIDLNSLKRESKIQNFQIALNILEKEYNVPKIIECEDVDPSRFDENALILYLGVVINTFTLPSHYQKGPDQILYPSIPHSVSSSIIVQEDPEVSLLKAKISGLERKVEYLTNFANRLKTSFTILLNVEEQKQVSPGINSDALSPYQLSQKAQTLESRVSELIQLIMDNIRLVDELYEIIEDLESSKEDSAVLEEEIVALEKTIEKNKGDYENLEMENEVLLEENRSLKVQIAELQKSKLEIQKEFLLQQKVIQKLESTQNAEDSSEKPRRRAPPIRRHTENAYFTTETINSNEEMDLHKEVEDLINELNL